MWERKAAEGGNQSVIVRWLRLGIVAAILLPTTGFAIAAWYGYQDTMSSARLRIDRAVRIGQEHASRVIETNQVITREVINLLGEADDAQLVRNERVLHDQLQRIVEDIPQLQSVWVWDAGGHPLVSNRIYPVPHELDVSDREYFQHLRAHRGGFFVSKQLISRFSGEPFIDIAHRRAIKVLVDGAQAVPHMAVDVRALDCDFYCFSAHKMFGPTGIGVLYGKAALLETLPPYRGGGDMILSVTFEKTTYAPIPAKLEAGTPPIAAGVGLGAAIDYLASIGMDRITAHEARLVAYATEVLGAIPGVRIIGNARHKAGVISFYVGEVHPHDVGTLLDAEGVAVRTGHHCAQPVMTRFGVPATVRASFAFYNTFDEIDALGAAVRNVQKMFS